jgi:hydroxymethylpyrimidine/phosphomethylpyrimidine kinase
LLRDDAIEALAKMLLPKARLLTPNLEEVAVLLGWMPKTVDEMADAARELVDAGPRAVLVKGGHLHHSTESHDVLFDGRELHEFPAPRLDARHTHGTGCTLSAAIAANLARGLTLVESVSAAKAWLTGAMKHAYPLGSGIGPVNHLWRSGRVR